MATDARISTGLPGHPKTKKLIRRLGPGAGWALLCLILWTRDNRADGDLSGMTSEDIELAANWDGENDALVRELAAVGFLDGEPNQYRLHDWAEHQPWATGSEARSEKSRWAALCKQHGRTEAARLMPEYAERLRSASQTHATSVPLAPAEVPLAATGCAPSPSPSPSPNTYPSSAKPKDELFDRFWLAYPRKVGKDAARKAFAKRKPDEGLLQAMVDAVAAQGLKAKCERGESEFVPHPATWLNEGRWQDELALAGSGPDDDPWGGGTVL